MSGQAIENVSIRSILPFNPSNGQVPVWNSTTQRWEAGSGGGFNIAANYSPTGLWNFTQTPQVNGVPLATTATVAGLGNVLKLGAALDTTLRSVTDQAGTASPLQLSTTQVNIGGGTALGRFVVRGDGTNPVARFESSAGLSVISITEASGILLGNASSRPTISPFSATGAAFDLAGTAIGFSPTNQSGFSYWMPTLTITSTVAESGYISLYGTFAAASGSANFRPLKIFYTINNVGSTVSGTATGIFLNATETALNGMTHNLMDLQVGGVSRFKVQNNGAITTGLHITSAGDFVTTNTGGQFKISDTKIGRGGADGTILLTNNAENNFNRLMLGGTTSSYPSIKRNGAAIDFRLADDSAACAITALSITTTSTCSFGVNVTISSHLTVGGQGLFGNGSLSFLTPSAVLEATSTTKGFLPPRMTTANKTAISSPATGLVLYDTDLATLGVYTGSWKSVLLSASAIAVTSVTANSYAFTTGGFTINASFSNEIGLGSLLATSPALNVATANTLKIVAASGVGTFQFLQAKLQTDTNFVSSGLETCTGYLTLYDALGVAYKVMVSGTA